MLVGEFSSKQLNSKNLLGEITEHSLKVTAMQNKPTHSSEVRSRVSSLGVETLMELCEWEFRQRPRTLRKLRAEYVAFATRLYRVLGRANKSKSDTVASGGRPRESK